MAYVTRCVRSAAENDHRHLLQELYKAFMTFARDPAPIVRQAAVFGIGVLAQQSGESFVPLVHEVLSMLVPLVSMPEALSEDNLPATENVISAISKVCITHPNAVGEHLQQMIALVASNLPLELDLDEAVIVHEHLCHYLSTYVPQLEEH